jgi:hypothetical protein
MLGAGERLKTAACIVVEASKQQRQEKLLPLLV